MVNIGNKVVLLDANVLFNNSTLTLGDNVTVLFEKGAKLDLCPNSTLIVGNNVTFRTENNDPCLGLLKFGNNAQSITFNNTTFINVPIEINNTDKSGEIKWDLLCSNRSKASSGIYIIKPNNISGAKPTKCIVIN